MALLNRLSRMMQADLHAVLDRIEEPELLLRQAVREMEDDLARRASRIEAMAREGEQLRARAGQLEQAIAAIDEELDLCFESGKDDLARGLVRRKLETRRLAETLAERAEQLDKDRQTEQRRLDDNRLRFEAMRQKAELFVHADEERAETVGIRDEDVEVALLKEIKRRATS